MDLSFVTSELAVAYFLLGLVVLSLGAFWFIEGAVSLSTRLRIPKLLIGSVIMSLATTSPEVMVSLTAVTQGQELIALGNIFGSFIANIGLVLGISGLIRPIKVSYIILHRQIPFSIAALILLVILSMGAYVETIDTVLLLGILVVWLGWLARSASHDSLAIELPEARSLGLTFVWFVAGIVFMQVGSYVLVSAAEAIAINAGISPYVVGISIVAIGTSLPELASGIYGAYKGEYELILGNILGANILLLLFVLPVICLFSPHPVVLSSAWGDYLFMGVSSVFLWLFSARFDRSWQINRLEAGLLLLIFCCYQFFAYR
ncbi:MAG: calcium/sodium antiporter [Pseudomonadota bacterium]|nr:calcium/sodium antiporter [Pseudomonadota bacterium]